MGNWTGSFRLGKASWEWWFGCAPRLPPLWAEELQLPRRLRRQPRQRSGCFSFGLSPCLNLENVAGAPGQVLLQEEDGAESLETVYEEAESHQGDPFLSGAPRERRGGGDHPWGQLQRYLRFLPLPSGAPLPGRSCSGPTLYLHCPNEGGLGIWGIGCLTALMGSVVKEPFQSNAFLKNRRIFNSTHSSENHSRAIPSSHNACFREVPARFHFFFFFFFFNVLQVMGTCSLLKGYDFHLKSSISYSLS